MIDLTADLIIPDSIVEMAIVKDNHSIICRCPVREVVNHGLNTIWTGVIVKNPQDLVLFAVPEVYDDNSRMLARKYCRDEHDGCIVVDKDTFKLNAIPCGCFIGDGNVIGIIINVFDNYPAILEPGSVLARIDFARAVDNVNTTEI